MSNFRFADKKPSGRHKMRLRGKATSGDLTWDRINRMPDGHLGCAACEHPWWQVYLEADHLEAACDDCGAHGRLDITTIQPETGQIRCPDCKSKRFAIIKNGDAFCIGCKGCSYEVTMQIPKALIWTPPEKKLSK